MSEGKEEGKISESGEEKESPAVLADDNNEELVFSRHEKFGWTYNRSSSTALEELKSELCKLYGLKSLFHCFKILAHTKE